MLLKTVRLIFVLAAAVVAGFVSRYFSKVSAGESLFYSLAAGAAAAGLVAVDLAFRATLNPGDEAIVPEPCYVAYTPDIVLAGGVPRTVPTRLENEFRVQPEEIALEPTLAALGVTREQLVDMALLIGTDFNDGVRGIGPKKSMNLIKKHGSLEPALVELGVDIESKDEVRRIFLEPRVLPDVRVEFRDPDAEAVRRMLCDEFAFSRDRIDQALAKFAESRSTQKQRSLDTWFG